MQRRATAEFISSAPVTVRLRRQQKKRDTLLRGGTVIVYDETMPMQTFRVAHGPPRRRRLENTPPHPQHGEVTFGKDLLIGRWDADIETGDEFEYDGIAYRVSYVFQDRDYETVANIETTTQGPEDL